MSFPRYPKYKNSGVEWLGEVPEHWYVEPVKNLASIVNGYPFDSALFDTADGYPLVRIRDLNNVETETYYKGEFVEKSAITSDDVLIGMDGDFNVGRWRGHGRALLNQRMCCIRGNSGVITRLLEYSLPIPLNAINAVTYATTVKHLASSQVEKTFVAIPPGESEQLKLAAFLDCETAKIDALMAEQRRLVELLKEKRQAVISRAVTKGLNPHAPMKPSGIEWLGDVPEHWKVKSMRMIANVVRGASPRPAGDPRFFGGEAVPWVTVAEITKDDTVFLTETEAFLTEAGSLQSNLFRTGTLIYSNSGATLGVPKILRIDACANDGVVAFLNLSSQVQAEFLYYYLASITASIREKVKQGSGQPNLNTDIVKDLRFALPPVDEQTLIVNWIADIAQQFGSLTAEAQRAIDLLQERRSALISAAVTGQIDVRPLVEKQAA